MYIEHPCKVLGPYDLSNKWHINKFITHTGRELVQLEDKFYEEEVKRPIQRIFRCAEILYKRRITEINYHCRSVYF